MSSSIGNGEPSRAFESEKSGWIAFLESFIPHSVHSVARGLEAWRHACGRTDELGSE